MTLEIQPQHLAFGDMIRGRLFRIPSYQRAYSWQSRQRRDLFEDIQRTWEAGNDRHHFMATIVGLRRGRLTINTYEHQVIDIVDGQQRLTTLILLLKSIAKALDRGDEAGERLGRDLDETLVKPDEASLLLLQANHDSSNYFADYLRNGTSPHPSVASTLADRELLQAIRDCEGFVSRWQQSASLIDLLALMRNRLTFIFHEIGDEAVVYSVFEVLNSRGLDVSYVDRLKSLLMGIVFESKGGNSTELIEEVHGLWSAIYRCIGLQQGMSTEALRFAATLRNSSQPSRALSESQSVDVLFGQSKDGPLQVIRTSKWLLDVTQAVDDLASDIRRSAVTDIVQARLLATAVLLRSELSDSERQKLLREWENITFRLFGLRRLDARWAVGDYVRLAWETVAGQASVDNVIQGLRQLSQYHTIENAVNSVMSQPWYPHWSDDVRYFLFRYEEHLAKQAGQAFNNEQWNYIWKESAADSIDHILPQSSAELDHIHRIGNLVMIPSWLNSQLGAKSPAEKAEAYMKTGLLHVQEVVPYLQNWDPEAIEKREQELLQWATEEWS